MMKGKKMRKWHKWGGLIFSFFFVMFAISGIFLNHRKTIAEFEISRSLLPSSYQYKNWNNSAIKGTLKISPDSILMFGGAGIFISDPALTELHPYGKGLKNGADNQLIGNVVKTATGAVFSISTFDLYRLDQAENCWNNLSSLIDTDERLSDLQAKGDTLVVLSRSHIFIATAPYSKFYKVDLKAPFGYKKEATLFRTMWTLHSGELFGLPGKLFVDFLGIVSIVLCLTGVVIAFFPKLIKRRKKKQEETKSFVQILKKSFLLHNKLGVSLLVFLIILVLSGTFLRPPLLIAIIRNKVATLPGSILHSSNPWFDKLRCIRYDESAKEWILYSSDGFYKFGDFHAQPKKLRFSPPVSVMGVTVFEKHESGMWIVGSFGGLFYWNKETGKSMDAYTLRAATIQRGGPPTFTNAVSGYSEDFFDTPIAFDYNTGARPLKTGYDFPEMPESIIKSSKMSLWHLCLEIHVGRIYSPIIGTFSDLFVFIAGLFGLFILISGYIILKRREQKRKTKPIPEK